MILTAEVALKKMKRMALQIIERNELAEELILIGIKENGIVIAHIIADFLKSASLKTISVVALEINKKLPSEIQLSLAVDVKDKTVILIDDVANSGRTMLYALQPLLAQYPTKIETLALIERTHKQFPIEVNYVGLSVSTALKENIEVLVANRIVTGGKLQSAQL